MRGWWQHIRELGCDATGAGVGRGRRGRAVAGTRTRAHRGMSGVPRHAGRQGADLQAGDPEAKGLVERLHDYLEKGVPAGPGVHLTGRFQYPTAGLAGAGQSPPAPRSGVSPGRPGRGRQGGDAGVAAGGPAWGGGPRPGCRAITTCAWTATTTRCTRRCRSAHRGHRRPAPGPGVVRGQLSPTTTGSGPNIRRSPTPPMSRRPKPCGATVSTSSAPAAEPEVEQRRLTDYDTRSADHRRAAVA